MAATLVNDGRMRILKSWLNGDFPWLSLWLIKADFTLSATLEIGDLTQADFSGYSAASISWGTVSINGSGKAESTGSTATFTHNGGGTANTIYGYALVNTSPSELIFAEKLTSPKSMSANGDQITVTPKATETMDS